MPGMLYSQAPAPQPERGHFIWAQFNPQAGNEQAGHRPGIVISPSVFNIGTGRIIVCPITNQIKGSPFEVTLPPGMAVTGAVLVDQVKAIDWQARQVTFAGLASSQFIDQVCARLAPILGMRYP